MNDEIIHPSTDYAYGVRPKPPAYGQISFIWHGDSLTWLAYLPEAPERFRLLPQAVFERIFREFVEEDWMIIGVPVKDEIEKQKPSNNDYDNL